MAIEDVETQGASAPLFVGWGAADITPEQADDLHGLHHARVSEGTRDPVTATALALSSGEDASKAAILVSCDLCVAADSLRDAVRERVGRAAPELPSASIVLNATHTHTGPTAFLESDLVRRNGAPFPPDEVELPVMSGADYIAWAADRIADAAVTAWRNRAPSAVGYGLGQAVVGYNRRVADADGSSRMYGATETAEFSHVEGDADHDVNLLAFWSGEGALTGLVVNVACPAQVTAGGFEISADYWHDVRCELRRRLGKDLFVLPQCSAAGDQSPRRPWGRAAEERMLRLAGRDLRQDIAVRIADAVEATLPRIATERQTHPVFERRVETVELTRWSLSEAQVREAEAEAEPCRKEYEQLLRDLETHPEQREQPRWYLPITRAFRRWRFFATVKLRYDSEGARKPLPIEVHLLRLGDVAMATNPFELYLDFGVRIKARSPAAQTFLVQLAGPASYLPTARSAAGAGYGSAPASTIVGPEGGRELVEWTVHGLERMWGLP